MQKGEKEGVGLSILPRPDGFSQKAGENHSALLHLTQISISAKDHFQKERNTFSREIFFQKERNTVSRERFFPISSPLPTSHFLFLSDPWYLLRCRWMVGNSDGSVIETYSPDAGGSDGDNNKISISAKSGSMPPSGSQWTGRVSKFPTWNIQTGNRFRSVSYLGSRLVNRLPN